MRRVGTTAKIWAFGVILLGAIILLAGAGLVLGLRTGMSSATSALVDDVVTSVLTTARSQGVPTAVRSSAQSGGTPLTICAIDSSGSAVSSRVDGRCDWPEGVPGQLAPGTRINSSHTTGPLGLNLSEHIWQARGVTIGNERWTVVAAANVGEDTTAFTITKKLLAVGGLFTWALGALLLWFVIRQALRSVTRIRTSVQAIGAQHDLSVRVPVPSGRDEIATLATTMNGMLDELERADAVQRQFIADASHELRTPVSVLRTGLEVAASSARDAPSDGLRDLAGQAAELGNLVDSLLTVSRLDVPGFQARLRETDLDEVVGKEIADLRLVTTHPVSLRLEPVRTQADSVLMGQLVRNLVTNADRFAATSIRVSLGRSGATAVLDVDDDGAPVPTDEREHIFDRFVQLDPARADDHAGLGLPICRRICGLHGGTVQATEADDGWCRFTVSIPLASTPTQVHATRGDSVGTSTASQTATSPY